MITAGAIVVCTQEQCFERAMKDQKKENPVISTTTLDEDEKYWANMYGM